MQVCHKLAVFAAAHALVILTATASRRLLVERLAAKAATADRRLSLGHAVPGADSDHGGPAGDAEVKPHAGRMLDWVSSNGEMHVRSCECSVQRGTVLIGKQSRWR